MIRKTCNCHMHTGIGYISAINMVESHVLLSCFVIIIILQNVTASVRVNYSPSQLTREDCLCITAYRLYARKNAGFLSTVLTTLEKDSCYKYAGGIVDKHSYTWIQLSSKNKTVPTMWVAGRYLTKSDQLDCNRRVTKPCTAYDVVTREEWGARPPKSISIMPVPVDLVFIHHTAGNQCHTQANCSSTMRGIQNFHMDDRGWDDIGYNFLVGGDSRVYVGRGWDRVGAHTKGYNDKSIAISLMGNYMEVAPSKAMLDTVRNLIQCGINKGYINNTYSLHGHRDVRCTECPGDVLYGIVEEWPHWHIQDLPKPVC